MVPSPAPGFEGVLERMYKRVGVETLPAHLEKTYGITVSKIQGLDVGVFRVDHGGGSTPLVARLFSASRPYAAAEADLAVLRFLAEVDFPAERPYGEAPLSVHEGQAVLVTQFVKDAPKPRRPAYPILTLGAMIGRLNALAVPAGADRPSGALHHFAEGTVGDELRVVAGWVEETKQRVPAAIAGSFDALHDAVVTADGGDGLPEALVHPDPVPKNAVFTVAGPVLVDWTSAGRGSRLASMALVLRSSWAAVPFMKGYARVVSLTQEERDRLAGLLFSRGLVDMVFRVCRDPRTAPAAVKKLPALRRESGSKATELLSI